MSRGVLAGALFFGGTLLLGFALAPGSLDSTGDTGVVSSTSSSTVPTVPTVPPVTDGRPAENASEVVPAPSETTDQHSRTNLVPIAVMIPRIGVTSDLVDLGLNVDRTIEVPSDYDIAGWYRHRAVPGEPGPGVILGHVDSYTGPAVFFELSTLVPGDTVDVKRSDGSVARFAVSSVEQHGKGVDVFPTERVYGWTDDATLRLITCGGDFDRSSRSYTDNVVVFADLIRLIPAERVIG
ncbi:MAG: class F sortase [Acidimicrobiia bacterium]